MKAIKQPTPPVDQPYEEGSWYTVPVAEMATKWYGLRYVPIIGPRHADEKILNFPHEHYHIDWRFVSPAAFAEVTMYKDQGGEFGQVLHTDSEVEKVIGVQMRRLYCHRTFNAFPVHIPRWYDPLQQAYEKTTLGPKRRCPHQGADLSSITPVDGVITCPLHGLYWCAHSGQLLKQQIHGTR